MNKCKILSNLYYHSPPSNDFDSRMNYFWDKTINRRIYRIHDLKSWFESDFNEGEELIIKRIGRGKYDFNKCNYYMYCW